jgi:hypothetical protein
MRQASLAIIALALAFGFLGAFSSSAAVGVDAAPLGPRGVMPWMCLERCGNTTHADVLATIEVLSGHYDVIAGVSFERFNLGPNATLVTNEDLTNVAPLLKARGFTTVAMVSSFPYPPQFIDWMRDVFHRPDVFVDALLDAIVTQGIDGVNIDWEPTGNATLEDATHYAAFLAHLRRRLAVSGKFVTVDVATWSNIWNLTAINASIAGDDGPADVRGYVATMNTYALSDERFAKELAVAVSSIALASLLVGVETWPGQVDEGNVTRRFTEIAKTRVDHVAIWRSPVPRFWWSIIGRWVAGTL